LAAGGTAVVVATHDTEFAAEFADRALLLADGRVLADGSARDLLGRGWHFATEIARLLPDSGALTAAQGARLLGGDVASAEPATAENESQRAIR
jgi:energy-coupling factor transport system ATP-binding protein